MSQEDLGKAIGVTGNTIARWERGEVQPRLTPKQYKALAKVLCVKPEDLPDDFGPQRIHETIGTLGNE